MTLRRLSAAALFLGGLTLTLPAADYNLVPGATPVEVEITGFTSPTSNEIAQIQTNLGNINLELRSDWAPNTVTNFKRYIASGTDRRYVNTIVHRAVSDGFHVIQAGGYKLTDVPLATHITTYDAIALEYKEPNAAGTVAMARGTAANSATSEWFINLTDNSSALGQTNGAGGYAVFARVLGGGLTLANHIWSLPRLGSDEGPPLTGVDPADSGATIGLANFVNVQDIVIVPAIPTATDAASAYQFVATSSHPEVVRALTYRNKLILIPGTTAGEATITVVAADGTGGTLSTTKTYTAANLLAFTAQPLSQTVASGGSVTFTASAVDVSGAAVAESAYQWFKSGSTTAIGTGSSLTLNGLTTDAAGDYYATVTASSRTITSATAALTVATPNPGRVLNVSIRGRVEKAHGVLIGGFNLGSNGTDLPVLVRAVGPTLSSVGLINVLLDPKMQLVKTSPSRVDYGVYKDWGTKKDDSDPSAEDYITLFNRVGASALASTASKDAALYKALGEGGYTAVASGDGVKQGICIVEVFDASTASDTKQLTNFSGRGVAGNGDEVLIIGFVLSGNVPRTVLMRAIGPSLKTAGLDEDTLLQDPELTVYRSVGTSAVQVGFSDDWKTGAASATLATTMAAVGAARPADLTLEAKEAALQLTLVPGNYSFVIRGKHSGTGLAIGEVYLVE